MGTPVAHYGVILRASFFGHTRAESGMCVLELVLSHTGRWLLVMLLQCHFRRILRVKNGRNHCLGVIHEQHVNNLGD